MLSDLHVYGPELELQFTCFLYFDNDGLDMLVIYYTNLCAGTLNRMATNKYHRNTVA